jgi:ribonuclease VapC
LIVVDTSALVRIFLKEPGFERYRRRLSESVIAYLPVSCYLEFTLLTHLGKDRRRWIDGLIESRSIILAPVEPEHGPIAADAAERYGKGSGHRAQLNFGDCLSYAVAKHRDLPLLYVGDDFPHTDVPAALTQD